MSYISLYMFNEVDQKRRRVQHTADPRVFCHQRIDVIIPLAAFVDILGERHEQRRGISLLHQIPQMHQPRHSAVTVKVAKCAQTYKREDRFLIIFNVSP